MKTKDVVAALQVGLWTSVLLSIALIVALVVSSCGKKNKETEEQNEQIKQLKTQVAYLVGTIEQIDAFTASDYTDCNSNLPSFEKKICQIAQTANAEQLVTITSQLQSFTKVMQTSIYGADCSDEVQVGCPAPGSMMNRLSTLESDLASVNADISSLSADIVSLQADIGTLQSGVAGLNSRLNNFNGTGSSIETVISGIDAQIASLDSRLDDVEDVINSEMVYKSVQVCKNIASSGPVYEIYLLTGDNKKVIGYMEPSRSRHGLGAISEAGVTGHYSGVTSLNTRACNYRIYDKTTHVKLCWNNTNRSASSSSIDTVCNLSGNFANPTSACTCAN